jgi:hypothetical protein
MLVIFLKLPSFMHILHKAYRAYLTNPINVNSNHFLPDEYVVRYAQNVFSPSSNMGLKTSSSELNSPVQNACRDYVEFHQNLSPL